MRMRTDPTLRGWRRWLAASLLILVSLNALAAGYAFVADPTGATLGIPQDWLDASPFADYLVPGILLAGLGLLYAFAAFRQLRRAADAWFWTGLSGGAMVVWILVQVAMMGYDRHPIQTILQVAILSIGVCVGALAAAQLRALRRARVVA